MTQDFEQRFREAQGLEDTELEVVELELTEGLEEAFQRHHPRLYHWLNTKLGQEYQRRLGG